MKLHETNWDTPSGATTIDVEYPDAIIQSFVNWMRTSKRWMDDPEMLIRRFRKMNSELMDSRNAARLATAEFARQAGVKLPEPTKLPERTTAEKRAAGLQKAREAKAAKKAAEIAAMAGV